MAGIGGRLRFLKRFSGPQIPPQIFTISATNLAIHSLSSLPLNPTSKREFGCKMSSRFRLLSRYLIAQRGAVQSFSSHSQLTERGIQETASSSSSSLFSPYLSVRVRCNKDVADLLSEALLCFGANSASMDEVNIPQDLDDTWITSIFADDQDVHACISHASDSIGLNYIPHYEVSKGQPCDWLTSVQETFQPVEITDGLWIIPRWRTPPDLQAMNIILDPGLAFGTGEHPTTKLCLLLLRGLIKGGEHFFDYGTGSGVLGIAALKMGAAFSVGIDIDPQAVVSARQNIALNEICSSEMSVYLVPSEDDLINKRSNRSNLEDQLLSSKGTFDVVIANILLNPLISLAEDIVAFGKPGAVIGVSGILTEQLQQIKELYSQYLENISVSEIDGWACLSGTRKRI